MEVYDNIRCKDIVNNVQFEIENLELKVELEGKENIIYIF